MNVIKLDDYRAKKIIVSGKLKGFSIKVIDGDKILILELEDETINFVRPISNPDLHDINRILINSMIAKIPICIDTEYVDDYVYHINDIGYYVQDK